METPIINYQEIFNLFCEKEPTIRVDLLVPHIASGNYVATDRVSMIYCPTKNIQLDFIKVETEKAEKYDKIFSTESNCHIKIKVSELESGLIPSMIDEFKVVGKDVDCDECGGQGEVDWEYSARHRTYTENFDCPVCDGFGLSAREKTVPTGNKIPDEKKMFHLLGSYFYYKQLIRLVNACKMIGVQEITKIYGGEIKQNIFQVGEFKIVVMPLSRDSEYGKDKPTRIELNTIN